MKCKDCKDKYECSYLQNRFGVIKCDYDKSTVDLVHFMEMKEVNIKVDNK